MLSKEEIKMCFFAVDTFIQRLEWYGEEVSDEWYALRDKLEKLLKELP